MTFKQGQTSIEFLVLLAISTFILIAVVVISNEQVGGIRIAKEESDATNAIRDISSAAKEVYAQGEGAKKQVYVVLPSSYEANESLIENQSIKIRSRGTDYISIEDFDVHGNLPSTSGAHWIWVISEENRVRIGYAMLSLSKNSIYLVMDRNTSASTSFSVENIWGSEFTVSTNQTWNDSIVTMDRNPSSNFNLGDGEQQTIELSFSAGETAVGYYTGNIYLTADDGSGNNETIRLPVTIDVIAYQTRVASPPLNVTPDFWGETVSEGDDVNETFTVCTNDETSLTSVTFTPSSGSPGDWIGNTSAIGAMDVSSCEEKTLTMEIPNGTLSGTYEGTITVVGQGVEDATDTISVFVAILDSGAAGVTLGENGSCNCPVGMNYGTTPLCHCEAATVYVLNGLIVGGPDDGEIFLGILRGGSGEDIIAGTNGSDIISGGTGNDKICGLDGDDVISGENGNDIIDGGDGADTIDGGGAGDVIYGKGGNDIITGGQGNDEIDGGEGDDTIDGGNGNEVIYGGEGNDVINGDDGTDTICGNGGSDTIDGDDDNDILDGGTGTDTVDGDDDSDTCYRGETMISCESQPGGNYTICGPS